MILPAVGHSSNDLYRINSDSSVHLYQINKWYANILSCFVPRLDPLGYRPQITWNCLTIVACPLPAVNSKILCVSKTVIPSQWLCAIKSGRDYPICTVSTCTGSTTLEAPPHWRPHHIGALTTLEAHHKANVKIVIELKCINWNNDD